MNVGAVELESPGPLAVIDIVFILLHLTRQLSGLLFRPADHPWTPPLSLPPPLRHR